MGLDVEDQLSVVEKALEVQTTLAQRFLENTDETDWDDFFGKPWLNEKGCRKAKTFCFLHYELIETKRVEAEYDPQDRLEYFAYETRGRITSPWGPPMDCSSRADSEDDVHSKRKNAKGETYRIPAWEVSRRKVANHSNTRCFCHGVMEYMGLKRLVWADIEKATNGKVTCSRVQIAGKSGKAALPNLPNQKPPKKKPEPPKAPAKTKTEAEKDVLWTTLKRKAEATGMGIGGFWNWLIDNTPKATMPQGPEEAEAFRRTLSVKRLQFLNAEIEKANTSAERVPGGDDDAGGQS